MPEIPQPDIACRHSCHEYRDSTPVEEAHHQAGFQYYVLLDVVDTAVPHQEYTVHFLAQKI